MQGNWALSRIPIWTVCDTALTDNSFRLLSYLQCLEGDNDGCSSTIARMVADTGMGRRTVQRSLLNLEQCGYLERRTKAGRPTVYVTKSGPEDVKDRFSPPFTL